ncbi:MAG: undecaprenyl/decaprenyl-phosphate alpha-N-acetylglucosaminyl 1-phosphate transferase, partial [Tetragenococcus halophilus]|nr:undecaprenyl/decaprenyl-phosphate alpha-N-acetylglucosaminyl 1-phosphate transferase [Tetragenococcus halophilus]
MYDMYRVLIMGLVTVIISITLTPFVRKFAFVIKAVDHPDKRRVNKNVMPSIGGLAIYLSFFISMYLLQPVSLDIVNPIFISSSIIILTGIIDDVKEISPKTKILGILVASFIVYYWADIRMDAITIPLIGQIEFGVFSLPITLIWVLAITNSINLIDGLDGLASGVSIIALSTMSLVSFFFIPGEGIIIFIQIFTLVCATLGFLPYNFYPAKLYLGDTGALFLGYMISVFSLYGLKNVTIISLIVPIIILGI